MVLAAAEWFHYSKINCRTRADTADSKNLNLVEVTVLGTAVRTVFDLSAVPNFMSPGLFSRHQLQPHSKTTRLKMGDETEQESLKR